MTWKQPSKDSAHGAQLGGPAPAHLTTDCGEPAGTHHTTEMDPVQRAALDRVYAWIFTPLHVEGEHESEDAA